MGESDIQERREEQQRASSASGLAEELRTYSRAEEYLESHRWVAEVHRIERTPDTERFIVSTSLQHAAGSPFRWDGIQIQEMFIDHRSPFSQRPEKTETLLHKLLRPVIHEQAFLHYIVEADRDTRFRGGVDG